MFAEWMQVAVDRAAQAQGAKQRVADRNADVTLNEEIAGDAECGASVPICVGVGASSATTRFGSTPLSELTTAVVEAFPLTEENLGLHNSLLSASPEESAPAAPSPAAGEKSAAIFIVPLTEENLRRHTKLLEDVEPEGSGFAETSYYLNAGEHSSRERLVDAEPLCSDR